MGLGLLACEVQIGERFFWAGFWGEGGKFTVGRGVGRVGEEGGKSYFPRVGILSLAWCL